MKSFARNILCLPGMRESRLVLRSSSRGATPLGWTALSVIQDSCLVNLCLHPTRIPAAPITLVSCRPRQTLPAPRWGRKSTFQVLPNHEWQGMPAFSPLSAPNPAMRRQLGDGIPFRRRQMGRGVAPWGWGAAAEGPARSSSAS